MIAQIFIGPKECSHLFPDFESLRQLNFSLKQ